MAVATSFTALGWIVLAEGAALVSTLAWQPRPLAAVLGVGLIAVVAAARLRAPTRLARLDVTYLPPPRCVAGEEVQLAVRIGGSSSGTSACALETRDGRREAITVARLGDLTPQGTRIVFATQFARRGWQALPPLTATTTQPFGLVRAERTVATDTEALVLPPSGLLRREVRHRLDPWLEQVANGNDPGDDELARLRPYQPGDPPHRVHWRASARARTLLIGERHSPAARCLAIVIDSDPARLSARRLDRLVAVAATLVIHLHDRGWDLTLHSHVAPAGITGDRECLLEALALLTLAPGPLDLGGYIPRGRAALVLSGAALEAPAGSRALIFTASATDDLVRLPRRTGL